VRAALGALLGTGLAALGLAAFLLHFRAWCEGKTRGLRGPPYPAGRRSPDVGA
jgi:hypothetical protein